MNSSNGIESITPSAELRQRALAALACCGAEVPDSGTASLIARSPITGEGLLPCSLATTADVEAAVARAGAAFKHWRTVPAPLRGAVVKRLAALIEENKEALADLVTIEVGKIPSEALGEVREMIDICDFAVGLSRQLDGRTMPSERPAHRLMETWHPLGVVGVITAFNFPLRSGHGTQRWRWSAATRSSGSPRR
jgi:aldehyde dehydrogenase (NAD+)